MPEPNQNIPEDWLPLIMWGRAFYRQQKEFTYSEAWQRWFIGGNGTGKTHIFYWNVIAYLLGVHPKQFAPPPLRTRIIVPSFDNVVDVALEKLFEAQRIMPGDIEVGPMMPKSMILKDYSKDHKGLKFKNGSSITWVTSEQGWKFMRGATFDILGIDEECEHRVFDENLRGLRNAKGGGCVLAGLTPPYQEGQGPTWTKEHVLEASLTDHDIEVFHACMMDNPAITLEFIKRFSRGKSKKQVDVQVYGRYPTWGDVVHPEFQDRIWNAETKEGHILSNGTEMPWDYDVEWVMAFDWHQSKPCAAIFGYIDKDRNIIIFDELDKELAKDKNIDELADLFRQIGGDSFSGRHFKRWQDPSAKSKNNAVFRGFNAWDAFRSSGILTSPGRNRDPEVGISTVNAFFKGDGKNHPRVFIYERCKYLRQALGNHYWKRDESGKGVPDPKWSDYPICLRYILQELGLSSHRHKIDKPKKWGYTSYDTNMEDNHRTYTILEASNY